MTWTTPLVATRSATMTWASLMKMPASLMVTVTSAPLSVVTIWPSLRSVLSAVAPTTW